jgi:hypothetical protein
LIETWQAGNSQLQTLVSIHVHSWFLKKSEKDEKVLTRLWRFAISGVSQTPITRIITNIALLG